MDRVAHSFVLGPFDSCNCVVGGRKDSECFDDGHRLERVEGCKDDLLDRASLRI